MVLGAISRRADRTRAERDDVAGLGPVPVDQPSGDAAPARIRGEASGERVELRAVGRTEQARATVPLGGPPPLAEHAERGVDVCSAIGR
jgi:hypothetical protein